MKNYPEVITAIRESHGMDKTTFARSLGVSGALVTLWEQGKRNPDNENFTALLNLATTAEQQAALLRARYADANFEIVAYTDDGLGGIKLARIPAPEDNEKGDPPDPNPTA